MTDKHEQNRLLLRDAFLDAIPHPEDFLKKEEEKRRFFKQELGITFPPSGRLVWEPKKDWKHPTVGAVQYDMDDITQMSASCPQWLDIPAPTRGTIRDNLKVPEGGVFPLGLLTTNDYFRAQGLDPALKETPERCVLSIAFEDFVFGSDYGIQGSCYATSWGKSDNGRADSFAGAGRFYALAHNMCTFLREEDSLVEHSKCDREHPYPKMPKKLGRRLCVISAPEDKMGAYLWRTYGSIFWSTIPGIFTLQSSGRLKVAVNAQTITPTTGSSKIKAYVDTYAQSNKGMNYTIVNNGCNPHSPSWDISLNRHNAPCTICRAMLSKSQKRYSAYVNQKGAVQEGICEKCFLSTFVQCDVCKEYCSKGMVFLTGEGKSICTRTCSENFTICHGECGTFAPKAELTKKGRSYFCSTCLKGVVVNCMECEKPLVATRIKPNQIQPKGILCNPCLKERAA